MFIQLKHKTLNTYQAIRELVKHTYKTSLLLPAKEKFNMVQQMRRAAISLKLNFADGCTRGSLQERKRFLEIARGSVVEIDTVLETAVDLAYFQKDNLNDMDQSLDRSFAMITKMMN